MANQKTGPGTFAWRARYARFNRMVVMLGTITILHRILILDLDLSRNFGQVYYNPGGGTETFRAWWDQYSTPILSGIASDLYFILSVSLLATVLKPKISVPVLLVLGVFYAANIEHIHYNFAHIRLGTLYFAADRTFIEGSGLTAEFLTHSAVMFALVIALFILTWFRFVARILSPVAGLVLLVTLLLPRGNDPLNPGWMQSHPLFFTASAASAPDEGFRFTDLPFRPVPPPEGLPRGDRRLNLLIVYLEGVSQLSLVRGEMPVLQGMARDGFAFDRYFGNQLQTSNGLYTTMTGRMPNFLGVGSPWDTMDAGDPETLTALPALLARRGYRTAFLQSAALSFMSKDEHLAQLGFAEVKGRDDWAAYHRMNGWGIDDLALFENTLGYIDGLEPDRPWMVSVLTSGTHAPYNVPEDFLPGGSGRLRALKYADAAVGALMHGLRKRGLLENTVVILTADESREPGIGSNLENEIVLNWLPLIVLHPDRMHGAVDWPLSSVGFRDLALSVAGDWSLADIEALNRPDVPLVFGNYYKSRVFWFDRPSGDLFACFTQEFQCAQFAGVADVIDLDGRSPAAVFRMPRMQAVFEAAERPE